MCKKMAHVCIKLSMTQHSHPEGNYRNKTNLFFQLATVMQQNILKENTGKAKEIVLIQMTKSFSAGVRKRSIVTGPAKQPPSAVTSFPRFLNWAWVSSSNKHDTACFPSSAWLTCCEGWVDKHRKVHWSNFTLSPDTPRLDTTHLNHTNNTNKKRSKQFLSLYHNSVPEKGLTAQSQERGTTCSETMEMERWFGAQQHTAYRQHTWGSKRRVNSGNTKSPKPWGTNTQLCRDPWPSEVNPGHEELIRILFSFVLLIHSIIRKKIPPLNLMPLKCSALIDFPTWKSGP